MAKVKTRLGAEVGKAAAIHLEDGEHQAVAFFNLRVLVVPDGKFWFAQGFELDYAAQGATVEEAKKHFMLRLSATIHHHLEIFGKNSIRKRRVSQVSFCQN